MRMFLAKWQTIASFTCKHTNNNDELLMVRKSFVSFFVSCINHARYTLKSITSKNLNPILQPFTRERLLKHY